MTNFMIVDQQEEPTGCDSLKEKILADIDYQKVNLCSTGYRIFIKM